MSDPGQGRNPARVHQSPGNVRGGRAEPQGSSQERPPLSDRRRADGLPPPPHHSSSPHMQGRNGAQYPAQPGERRPYEQDSRSSMPRPNHPRSSPSGSGGRGGPQGRFNPAMEHGPFPDHGHQPFPARGYPGPPPHHAYRGHPHHPPVPYPPPPHFFQGHGPMGMPPPIHFRPHGGAGEGNEPGHLLTKDQFAIVPTGRYRDKEVPRFTQPTEIGSFSYTEQRQFVMDDSQLKYYYPPDLSQNHNLSAKYEEYITRASVDEHIDALLDALIGIKDREEKSSQESSPVVEKGHEPQSSDRDTIAVESSSTPSHSEATKNPSAPSSTKADFICYRGILTKIMCTPYEFKADWELRATRFNGTIYIEENFKEEKVSKSHGDTERSKLMSYWGYRFETISCLSKPVSALRQRSKSESDRKRWKGDVVDQRTKDETNTNEDARVDEDGKDSVLAGPMLSSEGEILGNSSVPDEINRLKRPLESDGPTAADSGSDFGAKAVNSTGDNDTEIDPEDPELIERLDGIVNTNIQYCTVVKTKIGRHSIVMGAEVDCITEPKKPGVNPVKNYVELKTTKLNTRQRSYPIHSMKLLKFWAQSFLVGIPMIVVGCRDDDGNVTKIEQLETNQIPRMVRTRHDEWQWSVCVTFLDNVLTFLQDRIADDDPTKTYLIRKGIMSDMVEVIPEPPGRAFLTDRFVGRWSEDGRTTLSRGSN